MNPEEHRAVRELLGALALDQLEPAERTAVQAHLDGCPACRAELASILPLAGPLRALDSERVLAAPKTPPPWLEAAVLAAVRAEPSPRRRRRGRLLVAAAAVLAIGAGGVGLGYGLAPAPPEIPLEPVTVEVAAAGVRSAADVVPHTWGMEIKLTAAGFDDGRTYRVVVITDAGRAAPAGAFIGTGSAEMHCNLNSAVLRADATQFRVLDDRGRTVASAGL